VDQNVFLRRGFDGHSDGIQQSVEFNFAHRARSQVRERTVAKVFCSQIEQIAQIVSIERSRLTWLLMSLFFGAKTTPLRSRPDVRKITFG
jgi:hypothetical protein